MIAVAPGSSYRCAGCGINWPYNSSEFGSCPKCGAKTSLAYNVEVLPLEEGRRLVKTLKFEALYLETRGVPADSEADPAGDPFRAVVGWSCDCERADGRICWACDPIPQRPAEGEELRLPEEWDGPRD